MRHIINERISFQKKLNAQKRRKTLSLQAVKLPSNQEIPDDPPFPGKPVLPSLRRKTVQKMRIWKKKKILLARKMRGPKNYIVRRKK